MSIYPVLLSDFHKDDEQEEMARDIVSASRCHACRSKCKWKRAVAWHSLAWIGGDVWCSWKCLDSGKKAKPDKRRERSSRRRFTVKGRWALTIDSGKV